MRKLVIGTRGSALALWQAHYIQDRLLQECGVESSLEIIKTKGDKILDVPLAKIGGKGLFTKELEEKLLTREIDLAVHSLKDVPVDLPESLALACITEREDVRDCFVSYKYPDFNALAQNARVGTTSLRRSMQLKARRADIACLSLRGNIQTRLNKLESGEFDAIILAYAGLKRLGIAHIPHIVPLSTTEMIPAMGQAALGIECREDDEDLCAVLETLACQKTALCTQAEREFIKVLEGGCQVPIGVHCELLGEMEAGMVQIKAIVGMPDGSKVLQESISTSAQEASIAAKELAHILIKQGAREVLEQAQRFFLQAWGS